MMIARHIAVALLALVVMAASVCLCTLSFAGPGEGVHNHHTMKKPAQQPCDEDAPTCHVVVKADKAKSAPVLAAPLIAAIAAPLFAIQSAPLPAPLTISVVARPPPLLSSPINRQDRRLT